MMPPAEAAAAPPPAVRPLSVMVNATMIAVVAVTMVAGIVSVRGSRSVTGRTAAAMAEQKPLLDSLASDLRRAVIPPTMDADEQGIKIAVAEGRGGEPRTVAYRYFNGAVTRVDPSSPRVRNREGELIDSGPVTVATDMDAFPTVVAEPADGAQVELRYRVTFHSVYRSVAAANGTRTVAVSLPPAASKPR